MARLRNMYPFGKIPQNFSRRYCMVDPDDYRNIFNEIKGHVREKQRVMVSEGNSKQSAPVLDDAQIDNTQSGEDFVSLALYDTIICIYIIYIIRWNIVNMI